MDALYLLSYGSKVDIKMAPQARLELATDRLTADCSTTELLRIHPSCLPQDKINYSISKTVVNVIYKKSFKTKKRCRTSSYPEVSQHLFFYYAFFFSCFFAFLSSRRASNFAWSSSDWRLYFGKINN